jgi:hypothetical protein
MPLDMQPLSDKFGLAIMHFRFWSPFRFSVGSPSHNALPGAPRSNGTAVQDVQTVQSLRSVKPLNGLGSKCSNGSVVPGASRRFHRPVSNTWTT